jgi:hypothetical protein
VGEDNAPSFREASPRLALPATSKLALDVAFKGHGDTGEVFTEGDDLKPRDGTRQVSWGKASISLMPYRVSVGPKRAT